MHRKISKFISETFYESKLEDYENIESTTIGELCLKYPAFQPITYYDIESEEILASVGIIE